MPKAKTNPFNVQIPKLRGISGIKSPRGWGLPRKGTYPRDIFGSAPGWFNKKYPFGTQPEWAIYRALLSLGLKDGRDFVFKPTQLPYVTILLPDDRLAVIIDTGDSQNKLSQLAELKRFGLTPVYVTSTDLLADPLSTTKNIIAGRNP